MREVEHVYNERFLTWQIGAKIREVCAERGVPEETLASYLNLSKDAFQRIVDGKEAPSLSQLREIENILRLPNHFFIANVKGLDEMDVANDNE